MRILSIFLSVFLSVTSSFGAYDKMHEEQGIIRVVDKTHIIVTTAEKKEHKASQKVEVEKMLKWTSPS